LQLFVIFLRQLQVRVDDHFQGCHNCDPGKSQAILSCYNQLVAKIM
jgi:hypothetical protein